MDLGNFLFSQGKYADAILRYKIVTHINPRHSLAYFNWGNALRRQENYTEALLKYQKAIELHPTLYHAYNNRGLTFHDLGNYNEALENYQKAIEINPQFSRAFSNWGLTLDSLSKYEEAVSKYKQALELDSDYSEPYYNWGNILSSEGDYEGAILKYQKAIEISPDYSKAHHNWGVALAALGKYDEAIQKYKETLEIDPHYSDAYNNWGLILYNKQMHAEALQVFAKGIKALAKNSRNKIELIRLFDKEIAQDEKQLSTLTDKTQKNEIQLRIHGMRQILDQLLIEERFQAQNRTETSSEDQNEMKIIKADFRLLEYHNFLYEELSGFFNKAFKIHENKLEEDQNRIVPMLATAASFLPPLYEVPFDEKIFPLISKIAPDGIFFEDVLVIRKVNKIYQLFIQQFTSPEEIKQTLEKVIQELTLLRKDDLIADYTKAINPKTFYKLRQAKAKDLTSTDRILSKSQEYAFFDLSALIVLLFLEGLKFEISTDSKQKMNNVCKTVIFIMKELFTELHNFGQSMSEWCNSI